MKFIFVLLFLSSCAWSPLKQKVAHYEARQIAKRFQKEALSRQIKLPKLKIVFKDLKKQAGYCDKNIVYLDKHEWNTSSSLAKEFLVFHELGHCALNRLHIQDKNCELMKSYMCYKVPDDLSNYLDKKEGLLNELFSK